MQTMDRLVPVRAAPSRLNPSYYIGGFIVVGTLLTLRNGSLQASVLWVLGVTAWSVLSETFATRVFVHSHLTHGAFKIRAPWFTRFWLWCTRSGGVKYYEWVINHAIHHPNADTELDPYTPNASMRLTGRPALPRPKFFSQILDNARAYTAAAKYWREHPYELEAQATMHRSIREALDRLDELAWARETYGNVRRGLWLNLALFTVVALPLAINLGPWLFLPVLAAVPWAMTGVKAYVYLVGGYIINYFGHQAKGRKKQSNIPWWLMLLTLFMLGEGWHELHHDAPWSGRFHILLDPGFWLIVPCAAVGLISDVAVAKKVGRREYERRWMFVRT